MSWARLDDGFHDHPKVDGLSLAAVGLWTLSLTWAHRHRRTAAKPGHIPVTRVKKLAGRSWRTLANELVACALWEEVTDPDGWQIHDFADYLARDRDPEELAAAGRKGANSRWQKNGKQPSNDIAASQQPDSKQIANPMANDGSRASAPAFPTRPDPTRSSSTQVDPGGGSSATRATNTPPPESCDEHPTGTDQRCRACGVARTRRETWDADQRTLDAKDRDRRIRAAQDAAINADTRRAPIDRDAFTKAKADAEAALTARTPIESAGAPQPVESSHL